MSSYADSKPFGYEIFVRLNVVSKQVDAVEA